MATRSYQRATLASLYPVALATAIDAALSRTGHTVDVNGLTVMVTHPALSAGDDAAIAPVIAAYVYDPDFGVSPSEIRLRGIAATLQSWATDATAELALWDGQTQAQKNAALKVVLQRFGTLADRLADLLTTLGK